MCPAFRFHLPGSTWQVSAYTVFAVLAMLCVAGAAPFVLRRAGLARGRGFILTAGLLLAFVIGARLLNVIVHPSFYTAGNMRPYTLCMGGFSLYGGLLLSGLFLVCGARILRYDFYAAADALVFPGGMAFILSRIGCFLNGCCAGRVTNAPWGVVFPDTMARMQRLRELFWFVPDVPLGVHPTQLYELTAALVGLIPAAWLYARRKMPSGCVFLLYGLWFTMWRLLILPLRVLPYSHIVTDIAYPAMYSVLLGAGGFLLWKRLPQRHAVDPSRYPCAHGGQIPKQVRKEESCRGQEETG
jgi:phosphatidylglycerol:prolipoprotein diacylglycerol transferase